MIRDLKIKVLSGDAMIDLTLDGKYFPIFGEGPDDFGKPIPLREGHEIRINVDLDLPVRIDKPAGSFMGGDPIPQHKRRRFARNYITKRLNEGRNDAIEELSAYLADWLTMRQSIQDLAAIMGKDRR